MSTWQLFPDSSNDGFRWEVCGEIHQSESEYTPTKTLDSSTATLPSMADLLVQGSSKLIIEGEEAAIIPGEIPMFRTGLGKSVSLKEDSIAKAKSILADEKFSSFSDFQNNGCSNLQKRRVDTTSTMPLFRTGLGKSVPLKESSIAKAVSILGRDNNTNNNRESGGVIPNRASNNNNKVNVSSASMERAKALLGLEQEEEGSSSMNHRSQHVWSGLKTHEELNNARVVGHNSETSKVVTPTTKFCTAGGRSLSVSVEALNRARSLLGEPELGTFLDDHVPPGGDNQYVTPQKEDSLRSGKTSSNEHTPNSFISPLLSTSKHFRSVKLGDLASVGNLIKKFDAAVDDHTDCALPGIITTKHGLSNDVPFSKENGGVIPRAKQFGRPADHQPLFDITNKQDSSQKKRLGKTISVPPFKRPRMSSFKTPLKENAHNASSSGLSFVVSCDSHFSRKEVSTRYPERSERVYIKDYFGAHPKATTKVNYVPDHVRRIKSSNADKFYFHDESTSQVTGAEAFLQMLAESGASIQHASRRWVTNHYRWIVWKLARYETYYPGKCRGKFLTVANVLQELKYRYEREVTHGHCSAIKRILSGNAPACSMMVLCITAINPKTANYSKGGSNVIIELTDGWYSMNAALDVLLTKQLNAGKLFIGQKIRILGAGLSGWTAPTSPLEVSNPIFLLLNMNGTYRAHWADRLGFCKEVGVPLSFNCIKFNGGPVPKMLAGVTRIYPVLYKERLGEKKSLVRSEGMERKMMELHNQRRSDLIEGLMCEYQRGINGVDSQNDNDSEGAKLFKLLETAAEPEILMADMTIEQMTSFNRYKAKFEASKQMQMVKSVTKALEDAGLGERDVTPFMRVRLVGLTSLNYDRKHSPKEGILTIWNPTETQRNELMEGRIYVMKGLVPINSDSETLYLHARGGSSSSTWQPLSPKASESFQPFFNPRKPMALSNLDEIPLSSEFDVGAYVVYVGNAYKDGQQKKQWVFVTDGSINSLLAISFSTPSVDGLDIPYISHNLVGSVVGFCNLIKRAKDETNNMWVSEATENSVYFINAQDAYASHLKTTCAHIHKWANLFSSKSVIHQLRQRVLFIIGSCS